MSDNACSGKLPHLMTDVEVAELAQFLLENPADLETRSRLLHYYMMASFQSDDARRSRSKHIFTVIRNHPDSMLAGTPYVFMNFEQDGTDLLEATRLWRLEVEKHPENAVVLGNAAKFLIYGDAEQWEQAREWLQKSQALEPTNPDWPENLGLLDDFETRGPEGAEIKIFAGKALQHYERAYQLTVNAEHKVLLLDHLARNAFLAEEYDKAGEYAAAHLRGAALCEAGVQRWNHGNALHHGHIVLGKLALRLGAIATARTHLLNAGNTPGSPQLNSYGPDMSLAKEMLERGEKEAVESYLQACSRFWKCGQPRLSTWIKDIKKGRTPDFEDSCDR
jgi:tetratricopeptide (TPR) repeat protein